MPFDIPHALSSAFACAERLSQLRVTRALLEERVGWRAIGHHPGAER